MNKAFADGAEATCAGGLPAGCDADVDAIGPNGASWAMQPSMQSNSGALHGK
ncbi:MAG: hypothetical protein KGO02_15345 [Alphaproteobacteria bacterium]|nr:hypothetical protein [Alphaproteobacteria bacterium]